MKMSRNKPLLALALLFTMSQVLAQSTSLRGSTFRDLKKKKDKESPLERAKTSGGKRKGGGGRTRKGAQEAVAATKRDNRSSVLNEVFPAGLKSNMGGGMGMGMGMGTGGSTDEKAGEEEYASEEDEAGIDVDQKFLARAKEVQSARHKERKNGGKKSMGKRNSSSADGGAALDCGGSSSGKKSGKKSSSSSSSDCGGADKTSNVPPPTSPPVVALTQVPTTVPTAQPTYTQDGLGGAINTALFMFADCTPSNPCKVCEGDCDSDADCEGNLKCKERLNNEPVPGCSGIGVAGKDYCYAETTNSPTPAPVKAPLQLTMISENNGDCTLTNRCGRCEGDCDGDLHCEEGLICFQRNGFMAVPGCEGEGMSGKDYCIHPDSIVNTPVPAVTPQPTASPTATATTAVPGSTPPPTKSPTATPVTPAPTPAPVVATASPVASTPTSAPVLVQDIPEGGFVLTPSPVATTPAPTPAPPTSGTAVNPTSAPVAPPPPTSAPVAPPPPTSAPVAPPPPTSAPVAPPPPTSAPVNQSPNVNIKSIIQQAAQRFPNTDFSSPEAYQAKALKWAETSLPSVKPSVEDIIEYYGLACLYFATNGVSNYWFDLPTPWFESTKWLDPSGNGKCSWLGVGCNESTGRVETIDLHANNLHGGIPDEIALLADHLTALDLEENQFDNSSHSFTL